MVSIIGQRVPISSISPAPRGEQSGLGDVLSGFAAPFLDPLTPELKRQTIALRAAQANQEEMQNFGIRMGAELAGSGSQDANQATRFAVYARTPGADLAARERFRTYGDPNLDLTSQRATAATLGAGGTFAGTVAGTREAEETKLRMARIAEDTKIAAIEAAPMNVLVPDGRGGMVEKVVTKGEAIAGGYRPAVGYDTGRNTLLATGREQPGGIGALPPTEQNILGATPKTFTPYNLKLDDGTQTTGTLHPDGWYDSQQKKINRPVVEVANIVATGSDQLKPSSTVNVDLGKQRAHVDNAVVSIDGLVQQLRQPNAAAAVGWLGTTSRVLDNLRSQAEASVRLIGGVPKDQELSEDKSLGQRVTASLQRVAEASGGKSLAMQSGILQSRISDLAYVIAKAQDPSGRMSNQDIDRAADIIGLSLYNPEAAIAVLEDLKGRTIDTHLTRERAMRETHGKSLAIPIREEMFGRRLPQSANPAAPAPGGGGKRFRYDSASDSLVPE